MIQKNSTWTFNTFPSFEEYVYEQDAGGADAGVSVDGGFGLSAPSLAGPENTIGVGPLQGWPEAFYGFSKFNPFKTKRKKKRKRSKK